MESIGTVLQRTSSIQEDLTTRHIKQSEAIELGLTQNKYENKPCGYCGKLLEVTGLYVDIGIMRKWLCKGEHERCDCKDAKQYWEEVDRVENEKREAFIREEERKAYEEKLERLLRQSKLGDRFRSRTFEVYETNAKNIQAYETAKKYAEGFKKYVNQGIGLILTGTYGTGKTHLVAAICHEIMRQGYQPIFGTMISLLEKIKATYDDDYAKENEEQVINKYINCDLLIIDDLGKERTTEWAVEKLYYIINSRYEKNRPILITSNYNIAKLTDRLTVKDNYETAHAITSRLFEMCRGVHMEFEDYRKR